MAEVAENTVVDGRYRVLARIGSGGMADVYCAEDTHLGRQVALKVLYRRFAQDQEFVERFRREAKSAAGLQHPNVVNVFDRGEHDGTYYIAMEYLRGPTLKQVITDESPLDELRAIDVAVQILRAAAFAHRRGVIHRDFKPHNVMVSEEGEAKVTDFGIARAGASEITETGSIMGTAQYLSPEQAQGQGVTAQSDLYSIAVILYEMLAGTVPFEGDSAVAVALRHLNDPPPHISAVRPGVHPALEAVVMRGLAKDPVHRFADADEFIAALTEVRARVAEGDREPSPEDTMIYPPLPYAEETRISASYAVEERRRGWPVASIVLITLLALAALAAYAVTRPEEVAVPDVVGEPLLQATATLERAGLEAEERRVRDVAPEDEVIRQDPVGGQKADEGSSITLFVSAGPGQARIPSIEGLPERRAVRELNAAGFKVTVDEEASDRFDEGVTIRTVPREGELAERGSRVRLFISSGPERVAVPDVRGLSRESAESRIEAVGLLAVIDERDSEAEENTVIEQTPAAGAEADEGARVTITISTGPGQVEVPDVAGQTAGDARATLRRAGFKVETRERSVDSSDDDGIVVGQRPSSGATLEKGRTVVIIVGRFTEPSPEPPPPAAPPDPGTG